MRRWSYFLYGALSYLLFLAVYAYMAAFFGNFLVPKSIDSHPGSGPAAWIVNLLLIALFGVQHSVMARPWFKQLWTRLVPHAIERATYCVISSVTLIVVMWQWRGLDAVLWNVEHPLARGVLWAAFVMGWLMVPAVSHMINHYDLFGLRQVWLHLRGQEYTALPFRTPYLYARVRHPLYLGWTLAFWATPTMTVGHAMMAAGLTLYMGVAVIFEERDLVHHFGEVYRAYQRRVPMFVPRLAGSSERGEAVEEGRGASRAV